MCAKEAITGQLDGGNESFIKEERQIVSSPPMARMEICS